MNVSKASQVIKRPVPSDDGDGTHLWIIVGFSIGGALVFAVVIALVIYFRRRQSKSKALNSESTYIPGAEFCQTKPPPSTYSSSSDDTSETLSTQSSGHKPLGLSASLDPPNFLWVTSECVQPRPALTKWHTVASPNSQTTAVPANVESTAYNGSDEEELSSPISLNGRLWFSLLFHSDTNKLDVHLIKAKYLPGRGLIKAPRDPFVKLFLLPDEETFHQSRIRKRTLAPKFNEVFTFHMTQEEISHRTLRLSVYDVDKRKVRHSLGHVMFPLARVNLNNEIVWRDLETSSQRPTSLGDIQLCLSCNPYTNRIKVSVCKLRILQGLSSSDAVLYIKVQLYHGRKVIKSKRTIPQPVTLGNEEQDLLFDETFNFAVSGRFFDSCSFVFTVMVVGSSPLVKDQPHGRVVIGPFMYARGEQLQHWQEMLTNPRSLVTRWHNLETVHSN